MSKILIIEDEEAIRRVLVKILTEESKDYQVFEAEDGLAGTEAIKKSIINSEPNGIVLIAGKGHEEQQVYKNKIF